MIRRILESKYGRIIRYLISGGSAAAVDLGAIFVLVHFFHFWYLGSAVAAFVIAFAFSFTLQKYFTFREGSKARIPMELSVYLIFTLINLGLNTLGMYLCVHYGQLNYFVAQFLVNGLLAVYSYFIYKYLVFYPTPHEETV